MGTNAKTFRYSHIFKNLGALYLIFLAIIIFISLLGIDSVFFIWDGVMIGCGLIFWVIHSKTGVSLSELEISTKSILGTKSIRWSDIDRVFSRSSSLKLRNRDGDVVLTIHPRLDGSAQILEMIFSKRADLFEAYRGDPFLRSNVGNITIVSLGVSFVALAVIGYAREASIENYISVLVIGLFFCAQSLLNWYSNPRNITLENDSLVMNYPNKSVSFSAEDIESVRLGKTEQEQITSVLMVFRDKKLMQISGFKQTPFIMYPVLKQWHQNYAEKQAGPQLNRN